MNERPNFINKGTAAQHLTITDGVVYKKSALVADTTSSLHFKSAHCHTTELYNEQTAASITENDVTIDFWFKNLYNDPLQQFGVWAENGEAEGDNFLFELTRNTTGDFKYIGEYGGGNNIDYTTTASISEADLGHPTYFALVITRDTGSSTQQLDYYLDGQLFETSSGSALLNNSTGGGTGRLHVPGDQTATTHDLTTVNMQQFRISKKAFTPEEILTNYQTGTTSSVVGGTQVVETFRGVSGSQYVYYTSEESVPPGLTFITKIAESC
jgi:hypothetical protein